MPELSDNVVCVKVMEDSGVKNSDDHSINSQVVPHEAIESVLHDPESNLRRCVAIVIKFIFKEFYFHVVDNWV